MRVDPWSTGQWDGWVVEVEQGQGDASTTRWQEADEVGDRDGPGDGRARRPGCRLRSVNATFLTKVMAGDRPVPAKRIEEWANALKLAAAERERFLELAWLTHTPEYIVELVKKLRRG